jgi:DNA-binding NtrC family response regulator
VVNAKRRVLLVDDDRSILKNFTAILERNGYAVETAENAAEALQRVGQGRYDVALIDIKLPDAEGTDLLLKLSDMPDMVKIIITGYSSVEYGEKAADYGADDFLVKPVKAKELLETLKRLT